MSLEERLVRISSLVEIFLSYEHEDFLRSYEYYS